VTAFHSGNASGAALEAAAPGQSSPAEGGGTWIVTDGSVGMEAQGKAVAKAVGLPFSFKQVQVTGAMRFLPAPVQAYLPPAFLLKHVASNDKLAPPWPRLVISIGRRSVPIAIAIKRVAGAFGLHIQNPKVPAHLFDLIAAPAHDGYERANVVTTFGAVHGITQARLDEAAKAFRPRIAPLPAPRIAVLLGGKSQAFSFPPNHAAEFGETLATVARETGGSLMVTPSQRTGADSLARLRSAIRDVPHFVWDGTGENPYHAFLAMADAIVVTEDSVNMVTEAAGTGKPVYVQSLPGRSKRLSRFHALMRERGATRPFEGRLESWSYAPVNDTEAVASLIRKALGLETVRENRRR
jgi:hypothetical protein